MGENRIKDLKDDMQILKDFIREELLTIDEIFFALSGEKINKYTKDDKEYLVWLAKVVYVAQQAKIERKGGQMPKIAVDFQIPKVCGNVYSSIKKNDCMFLRGTFCRLFRVELYQIRSVGDIERCDDCKSAEEKEVATAYDNQPKGIKND
jgi:hypothetical protein